MGWRKSTPDETYSDEEIATRLAEELPQWEISRRLDSTQI